MIDQQIILKTKARSDMYNIFIYEEDVLIDALMFASKEDCLQYFNDNYDPNLTRYELKLSSES